MRASRVPSCKPAFTRGIKDRGSDNPTPYEIDPKEINTHLEFESIPSIQLCRRPVLDTESALSICTIAQEIGLSVSRVSCLIARAEGGKGKPLTFSEVEGRRQAVDCCRLPPYLNTYIIRNREAAGVPG